MKFFNIDMHISIIHDIKTLLPELGHDINSLCMSGHTWVNNEQKQETDIINSHNFKEINQEICDKFYERYKDTLDDYDAFIHSYPPAFAFLFEKFNKPIYTIACTRYEFPCGSGPTASLERLNWLNKKLLSGYEKGQIKLIANNLYDKKYCEQLCGGEWKFIPSVCKYVEHLTCNGKSNKIILWDRTNDDLRKIFNHKKINFDFTISKVYDRTRLVEFSGIIHIPYNVSIMSAFEHYAMGIPIFVPSYSLLMEWKKQGKNVLSELSFSNNINNNYNDEWIKLSDWYDVENMPHVMIFESIEHLNYLIDTYDQKQITENMKKFHKIKKEKVLKLWEEIII
jgi:hypothetical protein